MNTLPTWLLGGFCGLGLLAGCEVFAPEPGDIPPTRSAVVYGQVTAAANGRAVAGVELTATADQLGRCPAESVFYSMPSSAQAVTDSLGSYRAVVRVDAEVAATCVWLLVKPPTGSALSDTTVSTTDRIPFQDAPPLDSVRVDVVLPPR